MPPRRAPDGTELSFLGMPAEVRHNILRLGLLIEHNTTVEVVDPGSSQRDTTGAYYLEDDYQNAMSGWMEKCQFSGLGVLQTCKELYREQ
ncbi:hypothetical protein H2200_003529 [Cladophialophora chaetospira]|uniref:Uncharacterized protein n=1 Tax=Cladophialophora chaetospira TaxID=386627 RepID=A0AA38XHN3_9EURO|nr:hypothetical protein H2200_003529 [Cladophialophora chaetospira]